jgi:3-dehydroquinate synthetase
MLPWGRRPARAVSVGLVMSVKIIMTNLGNTTVAVAQAIRALDQTVRIPIETYACPAQKSTVKKSRSRRQNRRRIRHVFVRQEDSAATGWADTKVW